MTSNDAARAVVDAAIKVHTSLGPGLLESVYEACLAHELGQRGLRVERQISLPVRYAGIVIEAGLRLDLLVEQCVVIEVKAVETLLPVHTAQLLTYLKLGGYPLGLLLNFNVPHLKQGIKRLANGLKE
jgi:GxxExxY protein